MLIVCNGAFKSGSTWLFRIIRVIIPGKPIPGQFHADEIWHGQSIHDKKLPEFLEKVDFHNENYVCKSHYDKSDIRDLLIQYNDVYILNIKRDLRDVIVSAYFHYKRLDESNRTFEEFYWGKGRSLVKYLKEYHNIWHNMEGKIYMSSYQKLHEDFDKEAQRIFNFLNYDLKPEEMHRLRERTTIESSRKSWKEDSRSPEKRFFRKGIMGDWKNYFTRVIEKDFNELNKQG